jgi:hypothetical protein
MSGWGSHSGVATPTLIPFLDTCGASVGGDGRQAGRWRSELRIVEPGRIPYGYGSTPARACQPAAASLAMDGTARLPKPLGTFGPRLRTAAMPAVSDRRKPTKYSPQRQQTLPGQPHAQPRPDGYREKKGRQQRE